MFFDIKTGESILGAEYIITNTFHGTIFSLLNKKKFVSIPNSQKVVDVIQKVKLEQQAIYNCNYDEFKSKLDNTIDYDSVYCEILKWRDNTINILKNIL